MWKWRWKQRPSYGEVEGVKWRCGSGGGNKDQAMSGKADGEQRPCMGHTQKGSIQPRQDGVWRRGAGRERRLPQGVVKPVTRAIRFTLSIRVKLLSRYEVLVGGPGNFFLCNRKMLPLGDLNRVSEEHLFPFFGPQKVVLFPRPFLLVS